MTFRGIFLRPQDLWVFDVGRSEAQTVNFSLVWMNMTAKA